MQLSYAELTDLICAVEERIDTLGFDLREVRNETAAEELRAHIARYDQLRLRLGYHRRTLSATNPAAA